MPRQDKNTLFRREALARLNDIDELDRLVTVTHPRAWLTLGAVAALIITAVVWASVGRLATTVTGEGMLLRGGHTQRVVTPYGGQLAALKVDLGGHVSAGQTIAIVGVAQGQAQATSTEVVSPYTGVVDSIQAYAGQYLAPGAPVLTVEATDEPLMATLYLPDEVGKKVKVGQQAQVMPVSVNVEEYGYLRAVVVFVADLPSTPESMAAVLQNDFLVQQFSAGGAAVRIQARLIRAPGNPSGYAWSSSEGPALEISSGTACSARIVLSEDPPITYAFPALKRLLGDAR